MRIFTQLNHRITKLLMKYLMIHEHHLQGNHIRNKKKALLSFSQIRLI